MTDLEQRLTGENKVLRDLLQAASSVLQVVHEDGEMTSDDAVLLAGLISQIDGALMGAPVDLLG